MKFAMMSDIHYLSRKMITDKNDKELLLQPSVSEQSVLQAAELSDVIFITGDLTASGDRLSHEDFSAFLHKIKESGKRIYVIFATHDYHHYCAYVRKSGENITYKKQPWNNPFFDIDTADWNKLVDDQFINLSESEIKPSLVEALSPEEIWKMYYEFGPEGAYSVHAADYCYCIDIDENTRCLMLNDIFRNEENLRDRSPTFSPDCFRWIKRMYDEAQRDGKFIFLCSHTPMVPAVPVHRIGASEGNRDLRSPVVGHTLADIGFKLAFTGHSHFCNVGYVKSDDGNIMYDITTPSVRFYPPAFRMIEIDNINETVTYTNEYINVPKEEQIKEDSLFEHYHNELYNEYYKSITDSSPLIKKFFDETTIGDIYFLIKDKAKLKKDEYKKIKDRKLFDLIIETVFNMLIGDGKSTPDTPEYKVIMSLCSKIDSVIDAQPFYDIKKKKLGGYSTSQIMEPMLFNNYFHDREGIIELSKHPSKKIETPEYKSKLGSVLMVIFYILVVPISAISPIAAAVLIPLKVIKKKNRLKTEKSFPNLRYN